jgi:hypothetical protein
VRNANDKTDIAAEKACAEELLDNLLPAPIAEELKRSGKVQPEFARSATILFADFQGFTILAEQAEPAALVDLLDQYCIDAKHERRVSDVFPQLPQTGTLARRRASPAKLNLFAEHDRPGGTRMDRYGGSDTNRRST